MTWNGKTWNKYKVSEPADSDDNTYRVNSYRVLLTRGRDGFIVYVPQKVELNTVYELFVKMGLRELKEI